MVGRQTETETRRWYKNGPLVAGILFMLLGLGNWITGTIRTAEHEQRMEAAVHGEQPSDVPTGEELELARVRMDFYHVVASGGRLMTALGFLISTFGLARSLRPQARKGER